MTTDQAELAASFIEALRRHQLAMRLLELADARYGSPVFTLPATRTKPAENNDSQTDPKAAR